MFEMADETSGNTKLPSISGSTRCGLFLVVLFRENFIRGDNLRINIAAVSVHDDLSVNLFIGK